MDRNFVISATIAAALHAGLLFGIRPGKSRIATSADSPPEQNVVRHIIEFILEPSPAAEVEAFATARSPEATPPALPEPPPASSPSLFPVPVPVATTSVNAPPVTIIPKGAFGPPSDLPIGPGIGKGDILRIGDLDNIPRTRSQSSPAYPFEAKRNGQSGTVTVEFTVDESGGVLSPHVTNSTDSVFNESALRAVSRWRFEPGKRDGRAVRFRMALPIVFSLNGD